MGTRTEEVERSERAIKDAEIRQRTLLVQIEALDKELAALEFNEYVLQDNLDTLKQDKIIAIASEYKKAKEEVAKARAKRVQVSNERVKLGHQCDEMTKFLNKALEAHEELMYRLNNNVLYGNFRKQADGQT